MNKQNLILTSTVGMPRESWLEFRKPMNHIKKFIVDTWNKGIKPSPLPFTQEQFWGAEPFFRFAALETVFNSKAWKEFTFPVLGASEIATVMGLNPYKSSIELYFEKVGAKEVPDFDNAAMFWGRELEAEIADKWQYWEGDTERMIENFNNKTIVRKCRRLNAYVQNKQFPWLFASLDRIINKQKNGKETIDEGSLECKTISGYSANMWDGGIPVMYVAQLQAQLLTCGFEYGEIAILKDGRYFEVYGFDKHKEISERILKFSEHFFNIVKEGAMNFLLHSYAVNETDQQKYYSLCENLAPEADGSDAYKNYLSETYTKVETPMIEGTEEHVILAKNYEFHRLDIKATTVKQTEAANKLKAFMKDAGKLDLGEAGYCTWNETAKGRTFLVKVKLEEGYVPPVEVAEAVEESDRGE